MDTLTSLLSRPAVLIATSLLAAALFAVFRAYSFWSRRGIPGPFPLPLIGTNWQFAFTPVAEVLTTNPKRFGRVYGTYIGFVPVLNVSDAALIQRLVVTDFTQLVNHGPFPTAHPAFESMLVLKYDEAWKQTRAVLQPTFSVGKIRRMRPLMAKCIDELVAALDFIVDHRAGRLDVKPLMSNLSLGIIGRCGFGVDMRTFEGYEGGAKATPETTPSFYMTQMNRFNETSLTGMLAATALPTRVARLIKASVFSWSWVDFWMNLSSELVARRRAMHAKTGVKATESAVDLLEHIIVAGEKRMEGDRAAEILMSDYEMAANTFLMLMAGFESSSSLISFTVYAMARDPPIQQRLYDEITGLVEKYRREKRTTTTTTVEPDGGEEEVIEEMVSKTHNWLDAMLNESLRLWTAIPGTERVVSAEEYHFPGGCGTPPLVFKRGQRILINIQGVQLDPEYWPEPERYDPERFMPENVHRIVPGSFLPFLIGPRNCIGMRFALQEAKMTLARLVRRFKFDMIEGVTRDPPEFEVGGLTPRAELLLRVTRRQ